MLVVVAVAVWVAKPDQQAPCGATHSAPGSLPGWPDPLSPSRSGVANRHTNASLPAQRGEARYYAFSSGVACSLPALPLDGFYVGISDEEYGRADLCGAYLDVHGPRGDVRVLIADRCPGCAPGQLDLSTAAFEQIAARSDGVAQIRYAVVRDPNPAPELVYQVKPDSSADWLAILVTGTGNPIQRIALRSETGGSWQELNRGMDNYWTISRAGPGPFTIRITDVNGHQAQVFGISPDSGLRFTGAQLYHTAEFDNAEPPPQSTTPPAPPPSAVATTTPESMQTSGGVASGCDP